MTQFNRRTMIKIGGAAAALPLLGSRAFAQEKLKVGFVLIGTPDDNGWNHGHDRGRRGQEREPPAGGSQQDGDPPHPAFLRSDRIQPPAPSSPPRASTPRPIMTSIGPWVAV